MMIGVRAHDYGRDTPDGLFSRIHADGFTTVQLAIKKAITQVSDFSDITEGLVEELDAALKLNRLSVAVLGVYIEPSLTDESQRKKAVAEFTKSLPIAKRLGARCIGTETTSMAKHNATRNDAYAQLLRSLDEIMPAAEALGVTVAVEPVYYHTLNTPELAAQLLHEVRSDNLKIIFDPVNLLMPEEVAAQSSLWERAFAAFDGNIEAVHIKGMRIGSDGRPVSSSLRESVVDYQTIFRFLAGLSPNIPVLREEAKPETAKQDIEFLRSLIK